MVQQCLWNKPIRTETNSMGPGSTARPFTTSYRINECFPTIFRSLILSPPFTHTHTTSIYFISFFFFKFFFLHQPIMKYLISSPSSSASFPLSFHPPIRTHTHTPHNTTIFSTAPSSLCEGNRRCKGKGAAGFLSAHNICWHVR